MVSIYVKGVLGKNGTSSFWEVGRGVLEVVGGGGRDWVASFMKVLHNQMSRNFVYTTLDRRHFMKAGIQKWGNSLALRIPSAYAAETHLGQGSLVEISVVDSKLVVAPISDKEVELERRLARLTDANRHEEVDFGPAVGKEVW
jgi:antitoxin MazE